MRTSLFNRSLSMLSAVTVLIGAIVLSAVPAAAEFVYVTNQGRNIVSGYGTGPSGALNLIGVTPASSGPFAIAADPKYQFLYVAGANTITAYKIGIGGELTPIGTAPADTRPASLTVDRTGRFLYVANSDSNSISVYSISSAGTITSTGPPVPVCTRTTPRPGFDACPTFGAPVSIALDTTNRLLYVGIMIGVGDFQFSANAVAAFRIEPTTGSLTPIGAPLNAGGGVVGLTNTGGLQPSGPNSLVIDPTGRFVYFAVGGVISELMVGSDGALTRIGFADLPPNANPVSLAVDPTNRFVYAAAFGLSSVLAPPFLPGNQGAGILGFSINANGTLTPIGVFDAGRFLVSVAVDPEGKFLYAGADSAFSGGDGNLFPFSIAPNGSLTMIAGPVPVQDVPASIVATGTPRIGPPATKDQCKDGGWRQFNVPKKFRNQGDCIQFVNTGK